MLDTVHLLITWTTYGTWLPGDDRGWRNRRSGVKIPRPLLEKWCRAQMNGDAVLLEPKDRIAVEKACREHCNFRNWHLHAVHARTNHVHVVVAATDVLPRTIRDQLKANCTCCLREQPTPLHVSKTWTTGGDCEILDGEESIEAAVQYVIEAQDKPR